MKTRVKVGLVALMAGVFLILGILWLLSSFVYPFNPYGRFEHQSTNYYSQLAQACDAILLAHPVTSNDTVRLSASIIMPFTIRIPGRDTHLPAIVRKLNPDFVFVGSNSVSLSIPPERMGGFGVTWKQDEAQSNLWVLEYGEEGSTATVFRMYK